MGVTSCGLSQNRTLSLTFSQLTLYLDEDRRRVACEPHLVARQQRLSVCDQAFQYASVGAYVLKFASLRLSQIANLGRPRFSRPPTQPRAGRDARETKSRPFLDEHVR